MLWDPTIIVAIIGGFVTLLGFLLKRSESRVGTSDSAMDRIIKLLADASATNAQLQAENDDLKRRLGQRQEVP